MVREKVINARQKLNNCDYSHNIVITFTVFKLNLWVNIIIYNVQYNDAKHLNEQKHLLEKYW